MLLVAQHGVEDGEELAHAGGESDFLQFASLQHLLVLSLDHRVVACGNEGRHIENTADLPTSAFSLAVASFLPTIEVRSEEHTSELQSQSNLVCRLLLEKKKKIKINNRT